MISLALMSLVVLVLNAALSLGIRVTDKGEARGTENQQARAALALIARQLKSAYPLALQTEGGIAVYFTGEPEGVSFVATTGRPEVGGLEKITYFVREHRGRRSLWMRTSAPTLPSDLLNDREGSIQQETEILPGAESLAWEYLRPTQNQDREEWVKRWNGKDERQLPVAVRLSWRAQLGELPYEWHIEVPFTARLPQMELLASPQSPGRATRRRSFGE